MARKYPVIRSVLKAIRRGHKTARNTRRSVFGLKALNAIISQKTADFSDSKKGLSS
jgi:hypothetical protein